jgi:outer membrane protein
MKKLFFMIGLMVALTVYAMPPAFAAESGKTAVVDFSTVINNSEAGKKANAELNQLINTRRAEAQEKLNNVESLKKALDEQAATLSAEDKKAKQEELNKVYRDYQSTVAQSNAEVQKKQNELRANVLNEIKEVLAKIAREENYTFIFDAVVVPYYDKSSDISDKVIQKYNESKK